MHSENSIIKQLKKLKVTSFLKKNLTWFVVPMLAFIFGERRWKKMFKNDMHILVLPYKMHFKEISRL